MYLVDVNVTGKDQFVFVGKKKKNTLRSSFKFRDGRT